MVSIARGTPLGEAGVRAGDADLTDGADADRTQDRDVLSRNER